MTFPIIPASTINGSYQISRSLRFRSSASAYLSRMFAAGTRTTWTWSGWIKRGALGGGLQSLFVAIDATASNYTQISFNNDVLYVYDNPMISGGVVAATSAVYRDVSAWMHIVVLFDTTNATPSDRMRVYINGSRVTVFATNNISSISSGATTYLNSAVQHNIGNRQPFGNALFDGYLAEVNFIDGQALTPSSFGAFDTNGVWQPAKYTGSYGTNGFYLNFSDNSGATATTIGKDSSGNSNNWTPTNIVVTSGTTCDSMIDSPTNYADGGNGRGNYCVISPIDFASGSATLSNANLTWTASTSLVGNRGTLGVTSGKWYWEAVGTNTKNGTVGGRFAFTGSDTVTIENDKFGMVWHPTTGIIRIVNGAWTTVDATQYIDGDVLALGLDLDSNISYWYKNGTLILTFNFSSYSTVGTRIFHPYTFNGSSGTPSWAFNFGQRPFTYSNYGIDRPAATFLALNTQNLPTPTIAAGNKYFDAVLWTANGGVQNVTGYNFSPDMIWLKKRNGAGGNALIDIVRGSSKYLESSSTNAEGTDTNYVTSLNSDGFSLGTNNFSNGSTMVTWGWDAGGAVSPNNNTSGSITSTVSANPSAGFSVVTYTGTGANATVGHGLGVTPALIFGHSRSRSAERWPVWNSVLTTDNYLELNSTAAVATGSTIFRTSAMSSTVIGIGGNASVNANTDTYVMYCFAPVSSFSAFGSFVGNGSSDGPMVYLSFRPRWLMIKRTDASNDWVILDTSRNTFNIVNNILWADLSDAEASGGTTTAIDILSNGFKIRGIGGSINASGGTYIYAAFCELPFKTSRAR